MKHPHVLVRRRQVVELIGAAVRAAVVDQQELPGHGQGLHDRPDLRVQGLEVVTLVENRDDDRDAAPRRRHRSRALEAQAQEIQQAEETALAAGDLCR